MSFFLQKYKEMAKTENPIIGATSGKIGNVIFSTWKGLNVIRSKPIKVKNPRTEKQILNRDKFAQLVNLYSIIKEIPKKGYLPLAIEKSSYNVFISQNIKSIFDINENNKPVIIYERLKISQGIIGETLFDVTNRLTSVQFVQLNYKTLFTPPNGSNNDISYILIFNATKNSFSIDRNNFTRQQWQSTRTRNIALNSLINRGDNIFIYYFFLRNDQTEVSNFTFLRYVF